MSKLSGGVVGPKRIFQPEFQGAGSVRDARKSMRAINKRMTELLQGLKKATPDALRYAVQPIVEDADRLVPKDTESLRESQYVETFEQGDTIGIEIGYGATGKHAVAGRGKLPPHRYAAIVHERPDLQHKAPTQYKYLQVPLQTHMGKITKRVRDFLGGAFR